MGSIKNNAVEETPSVTSNVAMAAAVGETTFANIVPVQLVDANKSALNVVDNATNIGKELKIKGDITKYFGNMGVKNTSDYELDGISGIASVKANAKFDGKMYNAAGQLVNKGYKGLVIMNGKKVVLK